jgi:hypothetical protein
MGQGLGRSSETLGLDDHPRSQVMEAREEVEETDDPEVLQRLLKANRSQQAEVVKALGKAFESEPQEAIHLTARLAYLARLESVILGKLPSDSVGGGAHGATVMTTS